MSTFEFVSVLLSIVISLALAHLLTGVAQALKARKVRFDWVLAGWWLFESPDKPLQRSGNAKTVAR